MNPDSAASFPSASSAVDSAFERRPYSRTLSRAALAALVLVWGYAVYRLGPLWFSYKDYAYGWFVPLLCLGLFWERWKHRPTAAPMSATAGPAIVFGVLLLLLAGGCLLLEVIPIWRFAGWVFSGAVLGLSFCLLLMLGGRAWVNHFAFPLLFFLVAVPWPSAIENPVIYKLSHLNAAVSTLVSNLLGTPAIRRGVIIETGAGLVGVDEACSGIRSFQATLMIALFLGELFRYSFLRRLFFLLSGAVLAFGCNVVRTTYLVRVCDLKGKAAVNEYHDQAGFAIMGLTLVGLLLWAWVLRPRRKQRNSGTPKWEAGEAETQVARSAVQLDETEAGATEEDEESGRGRRKRRARALKLMLAGLVGVIVAVEAGIEAWFRSGEQQAASASHWTLRWPIEEPEYQETPVSKTIWNSLQHDEARNVSWREPNGRPWRMYYVRWLPTQSRYRAVYATGQARVHAPEVCLSSEGMTLLKDFGVQVRSINGIALRTKIQHFLDQGRNLYLIHCYWDPDPGKLGFEVLEHPTTLTCLRAAAQALETRDRMRNEKRVMKIGVWGMETDAEAEQAMQRLLEKLVLAARD